MDEKYIYDICVLVFKIKNNLLPDWLFSLPTVSQIRPRNTRQDNSLYIPRTHTDMGARGLRVTGPTFWNSLPEEIKACHSISSFKSHLIDHLLQQ